MNINCPSDISKIISPDLAVRPVCLDTAEDEPEHDAPNDSGHSGEGEASRPRSRVNIYCLKFSIRIGV